MPSQVFPGLLGEVRGALTALTTTTAWVSVPPGTGTLILESANHSAAGVEARFLLNPYLVVLKSTDDGATWTDYSEAAQDGSTGTDVVLSSLDTAANGDFVYVGSHLPFAGLRCDVDAANGNASVLAVTYWNGTTLTDITPTDGTTSGGATFAVDGSITWTVPSDWAQAQLLTILPAAVVAPLARARDMYWVRLAVSAALDASTTLNSLLAINRSTDYANLRAMVYQQEIVRGPGGVGCLQVATDTGTADLLTIYGAKNRFV